jgi:hypothetical protein
MIRLPLLLPCAALISSSIPAMSEETGWRQAVDSLALEKTLAEGCASILKTFGDDAPMARVQAQRLYARARADVDGLIVLLAVDLSSERAPAEAPELVQRLKAVVEQRQALCRYVEATVGAALPDASERAPAADLLAQGSGEPTGSLIEATVQIWQAYRAAAEPARETIVAELEGTRWRDYADLPRE